MSRLAIENSPNESVARWSEQHVDQSDVAGVFGHARRLGNDPESWRRIRDCQRLFQDIRGTSQCRVQTPVGPMERLLACRWICSNRGGRPLTVTSVDC